MCRSFWEATTQPRAASFCQSHYRPAPPLSLSLSLPILPPKPVRLPGTTLHCAKCCLAGPTTKFTFYPSSPCAVSVQFIPCRGFSPCGAAEGNWDFFFLM